MALQINPNKRNLLITLTVFFIAITAMVSWIGRRPAPAPAPAAIPPLNFGPICGAVTPHSATVTYSLLGPEATVRLAVSRHADLRHPQWTEPVQTGSGDTSTFKLTLGGLEPNTRYHYGLVANGRDLPESHGRFRTFPDPDKASSFSFAFGNSVKYGREEQSALMAAMAEDILFFLNTGDLGYTNIGKNVPQLFRAAYRKTFQAKPQQRLCRQTPLIYIWDDHDYGPNNSDRTAPGRASARQVYQETIPHYPLVAGEGNVPIHQTFDAGRVHFILTDLRSERSPNHSIDGPEKTMMGAPQLAWFKEELQTASQKYPLVIWVSTVPWTSPARKNGDLWGGFTHERRQIANLIKANDIRNLLIIAGDAHSLAADDGSNSDYAEGGGAPVPVIMAAPLDNDNTSVKGGPYSQGSYRAPRGDNCYGLVTIEDNGNAITVRFSGRDQKQAERVQLEYTVDVPPKPRT